MKMGLRKRLRDFRNWCPQPPDRLPSKLKRYSVPIAVAVAATLVLTVSFTMFSSIFLSHPSTPPLPVVNGPSSTSTGAITIDPDGSVQPATTALQKFGNQGNYRLTESLYDRPIVAEKNNVIIDGEGYALQGPGSGIAVNLTCTNVSIENVTILNWAAGVLGAYDGNTVYGCNFTGNNKAIAIYANNYTVRGNNLENNEWAVRIQGNNNLISGNQVLSNAEAFYITSSNGNVISQNNISNNPNAIVTDYGGFIVYDNNFSNNTYPLTTAYDALGNGNSSTMANWGYLSRGNYWADYQPKHPNATENSSGIWNTPYVVDAGSNVTDPYPLVAQVSIPTPNLVLASASRTPSATPPNQIKSSLMEELIYAIGVVIVALLAILVFIIYRQRKNRPVESNAQKLALLKP